MPAKLTLYIDDDLISYIKEYAKEHQLSASKVVNNFLTILKHETPKRQIVKKQRTAPITQSLKGTLGHLNSDISDYHKHLEEKYL
ncbi:MAG: DUF6364 family protein [Campylobacterota bacterium]|nr:DUF6364 family protein [Campylobacterota bacterium]